MEQALYEFLNAEMTIPVYYLKAPDDSGLPRIVFTPISESRQYDTEVRKMRLQVSIWHDDRYAGIALREEVYDVLQRYKGVLGGIGVHEIGLETQNVIYEPEIRAYQYALDFMVTYKGEQ